MAETDEAAFLDATAALVRRGRAVEAANLIFVRIVRSGGGTPCLREALGNALRVLPQGLGPGLDNYRRLTQVLFPAAQVWQNDPQAQAAARLAAAIWRQIESQRPGGTAAASSWWRLRTRCWVDLALASGQGVTAVHLAQSSISGYTHRIIKADTALAAVHAKVSQLQRLFGVFVPDEPGLTDPDFALPDGQVEYCGSRLSTTQLWHVGAYLRTMTAFPKAPPRRVLEIGGGWGALAGIFLERHPGLTYVIVDLPEALFYQANYLAMLRPGLRLALANRGESWPAEALDRMDVILVPDHLAGCLKGVAIDLAIAMGSLQEMPSAAARRYIRLIEDEANVARFYSLNYALVGRGRFDETAALAEDGEIEPVPALGAGWTVRHFELNPPHVAVDASRRNWLELLADRQPLSPADAEAAGQRHAEAARALPMASQDWFREAWSALRCAPGPDTIRAWLRGIALFMAGPTELYNAEAGRRGGFGRLDAAQRRQMYEDLDEVRWWTKRLPPPGGEPPTGKVAIPLRVNLL